jgi:predicted O-methyltransferase YrrM
MDQWEIAAIASVFALANGPVEVLEWGSGNSTLYFSARLPAGSLWDALENNPDWAREVSARIREFGRQDIRLHHIPNSGPFQDGVDDGDLTSFREYVLFPASLNRRFDFILVDGRARVECMRQGWGMLKPGGLMILHDAERQEYNSGIPRDAHQLRMTNPFLPGGKSVLFMARDAEMLVGLSASLNELLPEQVLLASDLPIQSLSRRSANAMRLFAEALHAEGDAATALEVMRQALDIDPESADICNSLGLMLAQAGQVDGAFMAFKMARENAPADRAATDNAARLALAQGRPDIARDWLESYLAEYSDKPLRALLTRLRHPAAASGLKQHFDTDAGQQPSCLFINTYYPKFLASHARAHPKLETAPYAQQLDALRETRFGDSDFYSGGLRAAGWRADDLIVNADGPQRAWASENGVAAEGLAIAVEQIRRASPDVLYLQDLNLATRDFIAAVRPHVRLIAGQIASPVPTQAHLPGFDILISSFPHFVERFRAQGLTAYYQPLAFSSEVLEAVPAPARDIPVSFVGGISPAHGKGLEFLEYLARNVEIDFWGYGREMLADDSPILPRHHGEAWGLEMFGLLRRSRITVNRHIDVAEHSANNMRLFEATGCGALLITDYKDNLSDLFEIGREVVAYRDPEECAAFIKYYLAHPEEAARIAAAGQARTLRDHSYAANMRQTATILRRHLRYQIEGHAFSAADMAAVAGVKTGISADQVSVALRTGWQDESIPQRQRALVQHELAEMYAGRVPKVYQVAAAALHALLDDGDSLLEAGCASGYYSEVLEYLLNRRIDYTGVDYSSALIEQARDYYPEARFETADATRLPFADRSVKVAFSSALLMHLQDYPAHLVELMRVARDFVVLHRTPVYVDQPTQVFSKKAYGVEVVELCFNQTQLLMTFLNAGWRIQGAYQLAENPALGEMEMTYVFARIAGDTA